MADQPNLIQPQQAPLSHLEKKSKSRARIWPRIALGAGALLGVALLIFVFQLSPQTRDGASPERSANPASAQDPGTSTSGKPTEQLAPFAELEFQKQKKDAQDQLAEFVELQLKLEEEMEVESWGAEEFREAKALAQAGDEHFLAEEFAAMEASYAAAIEALKEIRSQGESLYTERLSLGDAGLQDLDAAAATNAFKAALIIKPDSAEAQAGLARAERVPEVVEMLRTARNHELAGRFAQATETYQKVRALDPQTPNLDELEQGVQDQQRTIEVNRLLSEGFAALEQGNYSRARARFNSVNQLEPGNEVAQGGLQQVSERSDLSIIAAKQREAQAAEEREDWAAAAALYEEVLGIDSNIEFAKAGRSRSTQQSRARDLLGRIKSEPDKLSNKKLYADARKILDQARDLEPQGATLSGLVSDVDRLLELYANPVAVTLLSDDATEITLSSVGRLGTFENKIVDLRPGAYTLVGSRDGCRDVRKDFVVRPEMEPVSIQCEPSKRR